MPLTGLCHVKYRCGLCNLLYGVLISGVMTVTYILFTIGSYNVNANRFTDGCQFTLKLFYESDRGAGSFQDGIFHGIALLVT